MIAITIVALGADDAGKIHQATLPDLLASIPDNARGPTVGRWTEVQIDAFKEAIRSMMVDRKFQLPVSAVERVASDQGPVTVKTSLQSIGGKGIRGRATFIFYLSEAGTKKAASLSKGRAVVAVGKCQEVRINMQKAAEKARQKRKDKPIDEAGHDEVQRCDLELTFVEATVTPAK